MIIGPGTTVTATYNDVASGSLYFSGNSTTFLSTGVSIPASSNLNISTGNFTIECWFNTTSIQNYSRLINFNSTWSPGSAFLGFDTTTNKLTFTAYNIANPMLGSTVAPSFKTWNHVAVTRVGSIFTMYLNGVLQSTYTSAASLWATNTPYVTVGFGDVAFSGFSPYTGSLSNVRIVNGTAVYTGNFTPPLPGTLTDPVDPYLSNVSLLLTGDGTTGSTTFTDLSTINNSITNTGAVSVDTSVVKYGTGALKFSGTAAYLSIPANNALSFGTSDFTIEMWFYSTSFAAPRALITSQGYFVNGKTGSWTLRVTSATSICFAGYNSKTLLSATYEFAVYRA